MSYISKEMSCHLKEFRQKDFLKAFISLEFLIVFIVGIFLYVASWWHYSSKGWGYLLSIESIVGWAAIVGLKANCRYESSGDLFDVAFGINSPDKITALHINKDTKNIEEFTGVNDALLIELLKVIANKAEENKFELKPMPENKIKYHLVIEKGS